ncbi:MAG: helix-turn-helix transcriptional regulator [Paracoccaceae bacterium]|nr:helix-turn-helix transcriptional regulator [Paracoccaceae bacterium]
MLGSRLALARKRAGLTQREAAAQFAVSESAYKNYELGKRSVPHELVALICEHFSVDANWLLTGRSAIDQSEIEQLYRNAILVAEEQFAQNGTTPTPQQRLRTIERLVKVLRAGRDGSQP